MADALQSISPKDLEQLSKAQGFGPLLTALMQRNKISSDEALARLATQQPPRLRVSVRSVNNWRNGKPIGLKSQQGVDQVRKALKISSDANDPLYRLWQARVEAAFSRSEARADINERPAIVTTTTSPVGIIYETDISERLIEKQTGSSRASSDQPTGSPSPTLTQGFLAPPNPPWWNLIAKFDWHRVTLCLAAIFIAGAAIVYMVKQPSPPPPPPLPSVTGLPRPQLPYSQMRIGNDGFVISDSDIRELSDAEILRLNGWELYLARNEIFARRGRIATARCLVSHFENHRKRPDGTGWYTPVGAVELNMLSVIEQRNVAAISRIEDNIHLSKRSCNTH